MNIDEIFSKATTSLLQYESGDFLLLSDLSDTIRDLKDYFLDIPEILSFIDSILFCITKEMKQAGDPYIPGCITERLDFIQQFYSSYDDETKKEILKKITQFTCKTEAKASIPCSLNFDRDEETLQIFITEVKDRLNTAQELVLFLEENPEDASKIQDLFRVFHTIKGECGFLKIATLGELTHYIESILDDLRSGKTKLSPRHFDLLLEGIDISRNIVHRIEQKDYVVFNEVSLSSYSAKLQKLSEDPSPSLGSVLVATGKIQEEDVQQILQKQKESAFGKRFGEIAVEQNYLSTEELQEAVKKQKELKNEDIPKIAERVDPVIKVKASKVNFLVDMIGELLIALGQVKGEGPEFMQVRKITRSLQLGAMELRTDSLHTLFGNLKRAVRDLSKQLGKNVKAECSGEDLEIDRNLIEKLEEPLMHMIRNSMDHGFGDEKTRISLGKDPQGTVTIRAERQGNSIVISIKDNGRGLDRQKILSKAIEKGLIKKEVGETLNDEEVFNFIFAPGFSTSESVSLVSGRGVGMSIVKTMVQENRGRIEIESVLGQFSEFRLIFPLSTAIIDGMITRVSKNYFIFSIGSVIESIKITPSMITSVNGKVEVGLLRGESIPVIRMHEVFNIPYTETKPIIGVICETSDRRKFMFVLDEVLAKREVVIKSLGTKFSNLKGISSGTVLSGGSIGLVVDIDELVRLSLLEL